MKKYLLFVAKRDWIPADIYSLDEIDFGETLEWLKKNERLTDEEIFLVKNAKVELSVGQFYEVYNTENKEKHHLIRLEGE